MRIKAAEDAGGRRERFSTGRLQWRGPGVVLAAAMMLGGCGRFQDEFRGDSDAGRIQLDVERVARASIDDVTQLRLRERAYERVFTGHLPVDAEVAVSASVAKVGVYRRGGSWVFEGQRYFGRHAVWARTLGVASSDLDCVAVHVEPAAGPPARNRIVLRSARPCAARISLSVQPLDPSGRPVTGERVSDTATITVGGLMVPVLRIR